MIKNSVLLLKTQNSDNSDDKYKEILTSHNFKVRHVNTLVFNYKNIDKLEEKLDNSAEYSGLILSSPRCVHAVQMAFEHNNFSQKWQNKVNFVVGESTHQLALDKLALSCCGKHSGNAANLSRIILQNKSQYTKPFLFPHGNLKTDTLSLELGKEGLKIEGIEVYDTIANPYIEAEIAKVTDNFHSISEYVVFFSPSGFHSAIEFIEKIPIGLNLVKFVAIGPVTETAMKERDLRIYGVAKKPNPEELLKIILNK